MLEEFLNYLSINPQGDAILKIAQIVASSVIAITIVFTIKTYRRLRKTEQIRFTHDFFNSYRELEKESAELYEAGMDPKERKHWASRYFHTLEWFSFLVNTREISDKKIIGFYSPLIVDSYEKIFPVYYDKKEREEDKVFSEFQTLYRNLKNRKVKCSLSKKPD